MGNSEGASEGPRDIAIDSLVRLPIFQVRKQLDPGTVERYKQGFKAEGPIMLAPILVGRIVADQWGRPRDRVKKVPMGSLVLLAGFHRVEACVQLGRKTILANVIDTTLREARWLAAESNMAHGLPLKKGELREAFREFLRAGKWKEHNSLRSIARAFGVHHTTIAQWLEEREFHRVRARFRKDVEGAEGKEFTGDYPPPPTTERKTMTILTETLRNIRNIWPALSPESQATLWTEIEETYRLFSEAAGDAEDSEDQAADLAAT